MNFGRARYNHEFVKRALELNPEAKAELKEAIDQQVAEFLANGGQIRRFELISRDMNGKPMKPEAQQKGQ